MKSQKENATEFKLFFGFREFSRVLERLERLESHNSLEDLILHQSTQESRRFRIMVASHGSGKRCQGTVRWVLAPGQPLTELYGKPFSPGGENQTHSRLLQVLLTSTASIGIYSIHWHPNHLTISNGFQLIRKGCIPCIFP